MLQPKMQKNSADNLDEDVEGEPKDVVLNMVDRSSPRWAMFLGIVFTFSGHICLFALPVLAIFFVTIVAEAGEVGMVPILAGVGISFVIGMMVLDYAHSKALAGYRVAREANARKVKAVLACLIFVICTMIHPLLGVAIPVGAGFGALTQMALARFARREPLWDFLPAEAVSILSGRDAIGAGLAGDRPRLHAMSAALQHSATGLAVVLSLATGAYLAAEEVLAMAALVPLVISTLWAVENIVEFSREHFAAKANSQATDAAVQAAPAPEEIVSQPGLIVHDLTVKNREGGTMISNVGFTVAPGSITGILGESGAGKSLLLQALADPFSLPGFEVSGMTRVSGVDLWRRYAKEQAVPVVLLPPDPLLLPSSGADNLSCFHGGAMLDRGKWLLEQLVFAADMVESICDAPNATLLPSMQTKALTLARAFLLGPQVYLMDRPEDALPEKQVAALLRRLQHEIRLGRSVLLVTENRSLLDACDRLIILQNGGIVDYGAADQVRGRMESGWARFIGVRKFETEDNLDNWVRSHFRRDGDEANRRKVCMVASEMLALSCQSADPFSPGNVSFMFKHFEGYCLLRMQDTDSAISAPQLKLAEGQADAEDNGKALPPLAAIIRASAEIDAGTQLDDRVIEAKIETYDPRKSKPVTDAGHANTSA